MAHIFADISRIHITTIAALGVFTFGWLFVGAYQWLVTAVCALDWYIVTLINKTVEATIFLEEQRFSRRAKPLTQSKRQNGSVTPTSNPFSIISNPHFCQH